MENTTDNNSRICRKRYDFKIKARVSIDSDLADLSLKAIINNKA